MKLFAAKFIIFLFCFICLDQAFGLAFKKLYNHVKSGNVYKTNYAFRQSNEDIIIFGASEVSHNINSNQIADSLGLSCYNFGMDGQSIFYHYAILDEMLKRYKPKIVIISTFILTETKNLSMATLFPYYYDYQSVKKMISEIKPDEKIKLHIKGYAYNSLLLAVIQGNILSEPKTNGYEPLYGIDKKMQFTEEIFKIGITDQSLKYFEFFIISCLKASCKVYLIDTPRYYKGNNTVENQKIVDLAQSYSIEYFNFANDTTFLNKSALFKDRTHLNHNGATILTNLIIKRIHPAE